ncbi:hypothetical protein [Allonocardiopsis opalescens]|uniref:Uncharacterized protein n=1 Tax=Allonocardiopsis opalescens TaxID=1144618 RepID=A0A2T0Q6Y0_9ACTN|nr:hypothetical protein [Allonocardiopsis opalescens]PRX99585.1 hypothetical protein CLV72_103187 [Allonocardiopsis opalescens]
MGRPGPRSVDVIQHFGKRERRSHDFRRSRYRHGALALLALAGAAACASPQQQYVSEVNALCAEVNTRFSEELPYDGESFGRNDLGTLAERLRLLEDLSRQVREIEVPEGTSAPDEWLTEVEGLTEEMRGLQDYHEEAEPGDDLIIAMTLGIHDDIVGDVGSAAADGGFDTCAQVETWRIFPE